MNNVHGRSVQSASGCAFRYVSTTDPRGAVMSETRGGLGGPAQILLVTDQPVLADLIKLTLNHGAFFVRSLATLDAAAIQVERGDPHLVLLDMDIEGIGAEGVMERIGYQGHQGSRPSRVPVIALTRRGDLKTKLAAFDRGVDDILTVPFSPEELLARAMAVVRRTYREAVAFAPIVKVGELEIDIYNRRVRTGNAELHLTPLEQNLLYLLAANAGRTLSRDQILDHLWGSDYVADSNVVDRHVRNLRAKLHDDWRRPHYVQTVPGHGYRFLPVTTMSEVHDAGRRVP
jgi:two-component system, OmpR family, alkaline phosphatase synthesis response regulator PhoP